MSNLKKFGQYLFLGFLDLLAGYGYKPVRSVLAYLIIIFGFMGLYLLNAHFVTCAGYLGHLFIKIRDVCQKNREGKPRSMRM